MLCIIMFPLPVNPHSTISDRCLSSLPTCDHLLIVGDFNVPDVNWSMLTGLSDFYSMLCDLVFVSNLTQLVNQPTLLQGNILDLVLTTLPNLVCNISVDQSCCRSHSDHYLVSFNAAGGSRDSKRPLREDFNFSKADLPGLENFLLDCSFDTCIHSSSVEEVWSELKGHIMHACILFVPKYRKSMKRYPAWFGSDIKHKLNR